MKKLLATLTLLIPFSLPFSALAGVVYDVSDTSVVNCTNAPHGLWTNNDTTSGGSCDEYYSIQSGTLTVDMSSAVLNAIAMNNDGVVADIQLTFTNFAETHTLKTEGGNNLYNGNPAAFDSADLAAPDNIDIDFFLDVSGTIAFTPDNVNSEGTGPHQIVDIAGNFGLQFGLGANAKSKTEFGASSWIQTSTHTGNDHWDLNLVLTPVPGPATLGLFGLGLLVLGASRKRARRA